MVCYNYYYTGSGLESIFLSNLNDFILYYNIIGDELANELKTKISSKMIYNQNKQCAVSVYDVMVYYA